MLCLGSPREDLPRALLERVLDVVRVELQALVDHLVVQDRDLTQVQKEVREALPLLVPTKPAMEKGLDLVWGQVGGDLLPDVVNHLRQ